jgi:hypothetical protein
MQWWTKPADGIFRICMFILHCLSFLSSTSPTQQHTTLTCSLSTSLLSCCCFIDGDWLLDQEHCAVCTACWHLDSVDSVDTRVTAICLRECDGGVSDRACKVCALGCVPLPRVCILPTHRHATASQSLPPPLPPPPPLPDHHPAHSSMSACKWLTQRATKSWLPLPYHYLDLEVTLIA